MTEEMINDIIEWVARLFELNEGDIFTTKSIYSLLMLPPVEGEKPKPKISYKDFMKMFISEIVPSIREEYFTDKYFVCTEEGYVLTQNHDIVMESIINLEDRIFQMEL